MVDDQKQEYCDLPSALFEIKAIASKYKKMGFISKTLVEPSKSEITDAL